MDDYQPVFTPMSPDSQYWADDSRREFDKRSESYYGPWPGSYQVQQQNVPNTSQEKVNPQTPLAVATPSFEDQSAGTPVISEKNQAPLAEATRSFEAQSADTPVISKKKQAPLAEATQSSKGQSSVALVIPNKSQAVLAEETQSSKAQSSGTTVIPKRMQAEPVVAGNSEGPLKKANTSAITKKPDGMSSSAWENYRKMSKGQTPRFFSDLGAPSARMQIPAAFLGPAPSAALSRMGNSTGSPFMAPTAGINTGIQQPQGNTVNAGTRILQGTQQGDNEPLMQTPMLAAGSTSMAASTGTSVWQMLKEATEERDALKEENKRLENVNTRLTREVNRLSSENALLRSIIPRD